MDTKPRTAQNFDTPHSAYSSAQGKTTAPPASKDEASAKAGNPDGFDAAAGAPPSTPPHDPKAPVHTLQPPTLLLTPPGALRSQPIHLDDTPRGGRAVGGRPRSQAFVTADKVTASNRMTGSTQQLEALSLAVKERPLSVPPMAVYKPRDKMSYESLVIPARRTHEHVIVDDMGRRYELGEVFGSGSFGAVRLALKKDSVVDQVYVAKEIVPSEPSQAMSRRQVPKHSPKTQRMMPMSNDDVRFEVEIALYLESLLAPHAVLRTQDRDFLLLPQMDGDLFHLLEVNSHNDQAFEGIAVTALSAGAQALENMHARGYSHNDVKLENFLYDRSGSVVLGDLGLVSALTQKTPRGTVPAGTLAFMPFEAVMLGRKYAHRGDKQDIWGLGATLAYVLLGEPVIRNIDKIGDFGVRRRESQYHLELIFRTYKETYDTYVGRVKQGLGPNPAYIAGDDHKHYSTLFNRLWEASEELFPTLIKMLHYDPAVRINASALRREVSFYDEVVPQMVQLLMRDPNGQPNPAAMRKPWVK